VISIHVFRMPIFFAMAGFFGAASLAEKAVQYIESLQSNEQQQAA